MITTRHLLQREDYKAIPAASRTPYQQAIVDLKGAYNTFIMTGNSAELDRVMAIIYPNV